ncbi:MAG TPA: hypothetical protein VFU90_03740 [Candidatus Tumulicola sp.]|nr:hypothetical protein [Candidatus Tumulicola sp.]
MNKEQHELSNRQQAIGAQKANEQENESHPGPLTSVSFSRPVVCGPKSVSMIEPGKPGSAGWRVDAMLSAQLVRVSLEVERSDKSRIRFTTLVPLGDCHLRYEREFAAPPTE